MTYKVMQIEISNFCSLTCNYCPHPSQVRPKGDMSMETFVKCIELVRRSDNPRLDGSTFVWLNHFGEPLLNPLLPEFIEYAVSQRVEVSFASNGVDYDKQLLPRALWEELARRGLKAVDLSAHAKSEKALRAHIGDIVKVLGVWKPRKEYLHDWAGQVDVSRFDVIARAVPSSPCDYDTHNMFAVTWDGRIAACCYDIEARTSLTIDDVLRDGFSFREISLCAGCRLGRGDVDWLSAPLTQIAALKRQEAARGAD